MEQNQNTSLFQLNLDAQNSYTLRSAASWAKVLGIVGLIIGVLCIIAGVIAQQALNQYGGTGYYRNNSGLSARALGNAGLVAYIIMGLIFIVSSIFALNAGNKINQGLKTNDQGVLNAGFAAARNYFAFWAILMIIMLLFMLIGVLGSLGNN
jgi:amino acid permease